MVSISGERAEELDDAPGRKRKFVSSDNISKTEDGRGRLSWVHGERSFGLFVIAAKFEETIHMFVVSYGHYKTCKNFLNKLLLVNW